MAKLSATTAASISAFGCLASLYAPVYASNKRASLLCSIKRAQKWLKTTLLGRTAYWLVQIDASQSARSSSPPGLHSLYRPPRFAGLRKCPQPASAPVRVARSASAPSHPRSPPIPKSYGFIPPSATTSSARQLIAAACSASPLHVRAILTRAALSVGSGRCALIEGNQWRFADSRRECSRPSPPVLVPRGIGCHESAAKKGQDIERQRGIDCASAPRKLAVDLKGRRAHTRACPRQPSCPRSSMAPYVALTELHGFQNPHA